MFKRHPIYTLYGVLLIAGIGYAQFRGVGSVRPDELKNVPKTIRDNPGAWRAHYGGSTRYIGGK